jgi:uncharacterized membrane protein
MKRHPNEKIIYGLFEKPAELEHAYDSLVRSGIEVEDISLLMNEDVHDRDFKALDRTKTKEGAAAGSIVGGTIGGVLGGVVALGSAITGIGLVVVGPALALAAAGGLIGGLMGHGVPEDEAKHLHDELHAGKAMMAVHLRDPKKIVVAQEILKAYHGEPIELAS